MGSALGQGLPRAGCSQVTSLLHPRVRELSAEKGPGLLKRDLTPHSVHSCPVSLLRALLYSAALVFLWPPRSDPDSSRDQLSSCLTPSRGGSLTAATNGPIDGALSAQQCDPQPVTFPVHSQPSLGVPPH